LYILPTTSRHETKTRKIKSGERADSSQKVLPGCSDVGRFFRRPRRSGYLDRSPLFVLERSRFGRKPPNRSLRSNSDGGEHARCGSGLICELRAPFVSSLGNSAANHACRASRAAKRPQTIGRQALGN